VQTQLSNKHNPVLYVDRDLVEKTRSLGFNLSKTFENTLKQLINTYSDVNLLNNNEDSIIQGF
jgi:post-segregation antitoxin (ccd killing protein)